MDGRGCFCYDKATLSVCVLPFSTNLYNVALSRKVVATDLLQKTQHFQPGGASGLDSHVWFCGHFALAAPVTTESGYCLGDGFCSLTVVHGAHFLR
jgi:hypothetical protein